MKKNCGTYKGILFLFFVFFIILNLGGNSKIVKAEEELPKTFTYTYDGSVYSDRLVYAAMKRLDVEAAVHIMPMTEAIENVNTGRYDGICGQVPGLEESYPNLVMVPFETWRTDFCVYGLKEKEGSFTRWEDLKGYRVGSLIKKSVIRKKMPQNVAAFIEKPTLTELYESLRSGECDVIILTNTGKNELIMPFDMSYMGSVDNIPSYIYLNKKYENAIPKLVKVLKELKEDGTFKKIYSSELIQKNKQKSVLYLSSYSSELNWERNISEGIGSVFNLDEDLGYRVVNLNSYKVQNLELRDNLAIGSIRSSFLKDPPVAVIVSDNPALEFVVNYYNFLFYNIPIVFCGVNNFDPQMLSGLKNITGVVEKYSIKETVEEMLKMFPDTEEIFVINDYSETGVAQRNEVIEQTSFLEGRIKITHNENMPLEDLYEVVSNRKENTLILTGPFFTDMNGNNHNQSEFQRKLAQVSNVPIFGFFDTTQGYGQIGGKYTDGVMQGKLAAQIVCDIFYGKDIPEINQGLDTNQWIFDSNILKLYHIDKSVLPKGSILLNEKKSLRETNPALFVGIVTASIAGVITIAILSYFLILLKKRNAQLDVARAEAVEKKEALKHAYQDIQNVVESVPTPIMIIQPTKRVFVFMNRAWLELFEIPAAEEILGMCYGEEGYLTVGSMEKELVKAAASNEICAWDWEYITPTGKTFEASLTARKITYNGEECLVIAHKDLTEERRKEKMLESIAEKEREASQIKSRFLMNIGHEIRTPMNVIVGMTQLMKDAGDPKVILEHTGKMENASRHLLLMVDNLLDMSIIEDGKLCLKEEKVSLSSTVSFIADMFQFEGEKRNISIKTDLSGVKNDIVITDAVRISQVLSNLLSNGVKFSRDNGVVELTIEEEVKGRCQSIYRIQVRDYGIGMGADTLDSLFKTFSQGDDSSTRRYGGIGLGLVICKNIVEMMGGSISVASKVDKGSTFTVDLEFQVWDREVVKKNQGLAEINEGDTELEFEHLRVLVVDDIEINRKIVTSLLKKRKVRVTEAENGQEAVTVISTSPEGYYDMILMDVQMPIMDGCQATAVIRGLNRKDTDKLPIVAMTANVLQSDVDFVMKAGMNGHLGKPISIQSIETALREFCLKR